MATWRGMGSCEAHILMASKCEDNYGETAEGRDWACPMNDTNRTTIGHRIPFNKMIDDQDDQVRH